MKKWLPFAVIYLSLSFQNIVTLGAEKTDTCFGLDKFYKMQFYKLPLTNSIGSKIKYCFIIVKLLKMHYGVEHRI